MHRNSSVLILMTPGKLLAHTLLSLHACQVTKKVKKSHKKKLKWRGQERCLTIN